MIRTNDDPVFDHSTVSYFVEGIGRDRFADIFNGLNQELPRPGLLSPEMHADSSLVKANVHSHQLSSGGLTVEELTEQAIEGNGLSVLNESGVDENGVEGEETRYFQDSKGPLPLGPEDVDAPWRSAGPANRRSRTVRTTPAWIGVAPFFPGETPMLPVGNGRRGHISWVTFPSNQPTSFFGCRHPPQRRQTPRPLGPKRGRSLPSHPSQAGIHHGSQGRLRVTGRPCGLSSTRRDAVAGRPVGPGLLGTLSSHGPGIPPPVGDHGLA